MSLKVRKNRTPPPPESCPLTECMRMFTGAWSANVIWYLAEGPRRFGELRRDLPKISAKVLSTRLRELEEKGVLSKRLLDSSPPSAEYLLTPLGRELLPALRALAAVGEKLKLARRQRG